MTSCYRFKKNWLKIKIQEKRNIFARFSVVIGEIMLDENFRLTDTRSWVNYDDDGTPTLHTHSYTHLIITYAAVCLKRS